MSHALWSRTEVSMRRLKAEMPFSTPLQNPADSLQKNPPQKTSLTLPAWHESSRFLFQIFSSISSKQSLVGMTWKKSELKQPRQHPCHTHSQRSYLIYLNLSPRCFVTRSYAVESVVKRKGVGVSQGFGLQDCFRDRCNMAHLLQPSFLPSWLWLGDLR